MIVPDDHTRAAGKSGRKRGNVMSRFLLGVVAVLIAVWLIFAVFSAVKGLIHLALVVAILLVAYNLLMGFRRRWDESD
jgi:uncharacterized membrane protein